MRRGATQLLLATPWLLALCVVMTPRAADARSFYLRTTAASEATQWRRLDLGVEASRPLIMGMELGAYDLLDDRSGSLNARFSMRYANDFGLARALQNDPSFQDDVNDLSLNLLHVQWRPSSIIEFVVGRQWAMSALGMRDFDGLMTTLSPYHSGPLELSLSLYGGRDVQLGFRALAPAFADAQGIPSGAARPEIVGAPLLAGVDLSMGIYEKITVMASYQRRWRREETGAETATSILGEERMGGSAIVSPNERVNVSAQISYHTILGGLDHVGAQTSALLATRHDLWLSSGVARTRPWFDSSSIFNIFGANPHDEAWLALGGRARPLRTRLSLRAFTRIFYGGDALLIESRAASREEDARALGVAASHESLIPVANRALRWGSNLSLQLGEEDYGGNQYILDTRARLPLIPNKLGLSTRMLGLMVDHTHHRYEDEYALSAILGVDAPVLERGRLSILLEQRASTNEVFSTNIYGVIEMKAWR